MGFDGTNSDMLAIGSIVMTSALGLIGFLVRTLYQKDSEAQRESIKELRSKIEALDSTDKTLNEKMHELHLKITTMSTTLDLIYSKLNELVNKK